MILNDVKLSNLDVVNSNNFVLTTDVAEQFINEHPSYEVYCGIEFKINSTPDEYSHKLSNLKIEDGFLKGDVEVLETPQGKILKALIDQNSEENLCGAYVAQVDYVDENHKKIEDMSKVLCFFSIHGRNY